MNLVDLREQMPNFATYQNWRRPSTAKIEGIVIHHTGAGTVNSKGLPVLFAGEMARAHVEGEGRAHVSYHYAVARDGTVFYMLDEEIAGYHLFLAIPSRNDSAQWERWNNQFKGGQYFNLTTIAIVLLGWFDSNRTLGGEPIADANNIPSPEQSAATIALVRDIQKRRAIPTAKIEGHGEILARTAFGSRSTCPGTQFSMVDFRDAVAHGAPPPDSSPVPSGPVTVPDPAPPLRLNFRNRPLVGLHARNDTQFIAADWAIIRDAKIESLKMLSHTVDAVYEEARRIEPRMEFIVRLFSGRNGKGNELRPDDFVNFFRDTINRLHQKFGVLKFEIHNEPNHLTGHEGWGQELADALDFQLWYKQVFAGLRANHPWALLGYPGLAVPHNDLQWLDWNREAIEMSDWLGVHPYWQTPAHARMTFKSETWGQRYLQYHAKYPHKLLEITEFGNSNGQGNPPIPFSREEQRDQYVEWFRSVLMMPFIGSAHGFLSTSPDPIWRNQGFTWGDENGPYPVAGAIGMLPRPPRAPDWYYAFNATVPPRMVTGAVLSFPATLGNGGRLPWLKAGAARCSISAKWVRIGVDGGEEVLEEERQWLELPHDMVSPDIIAFRLTIVTPPIAGAYKLRLALFHHGHQKWLHDLEEITIPDYFPIEIVAAQPAPTPTPVPTPTGAFGVTYALSLPTTLTIGEQLSLPVTLTNTGTRLWTARGTNPVVVVPQWLTAQGRPLDLMLRAPLPRDIAPQEQVTVTIALTAPPEVGTYFFRLDMAEEGKQFFSQQGIAPVRRPIKIEAIPGLKEWDAQWLDVRVPAQLAVGASGRADVRLRNRGTQRWEIDAIRVAYHWGDKLPVRVQLPTDVATGEEVAFGVPLQSPTTAGSMTLTFDLWREGHGWLNVAAPAQPITVGAGDERGLDEAEAQSSKREDDVIPVVRYSAAQFSGRESSAVSDGLDHATIEAGATVVAVMVSENTADVRLAVDGDPMTAWRTSGMQQGGEWIQVDFGAAQSIRKIRVANLPDEFPRGYRLERSLNGESWTLLEDVPENHDSVAVTLDAPVTLRYLRMTQTNRSPSNHWSVVEVIAVS